MLITQRSTFMDCVSVTLTELLLGSVRNVANSWTRIAQIRSRMRQRRHLRGLDERLLRDVGLTRADVAAELSKPFWAE